MIDFLIGTNLEETGKKLLNKIENIGEYIGDSKIGQKTTSEVTLAELFGTITLCMIGIPAEEISKSISEFESPFEAAKHIFTIVGDVEIEGITCFDKV